VDGNRHHTMLFRVAACWLIVLVLAPFTAPFPTCGLTAFFGAAQNRQGPPKMPSSATLGQESSIAGVPAISGAGRVRLSFLYSVCRSAGEFLAAPAILTRAAARSGGMRKHAGLARILRV
jgi:hypothetical protein